MSTMQTKAAAARKAKADKAPVQPARAIDHDVNLIKAGTNLAESFVSGFDNARRTSREELSRLQTIALGCPKVSAKDFEDIIAPPVRAAMMQKYDTEGAAKTQLSVYRTAFLAIAHGAKVPEKIHTIRTFVDTVGREYLAKRAEKEALRSGKVLKSKGGRKTGSASHNKKASDDAPDAVKLFVDLFPGASKAVKAELYTAIHVVFELDPAGKLLIAMLQDIAAKK